MSAVISSDGAIATEKKRPVDVNVINQIYEESERLKEYQSMIQGPVRKIEYVTRPDEREFCRGAIVRKERDPHTPVPMSMIIKLGEIYEKLCKEDGSGKLLNLEDEAIKTKIMSMITISPNNENKK